MMMYVKVGVDARLCAVSLDYHLGEGETRIDMPDTFLAEQLTDWRLAEGALVYDPVTPQPLPPTPEEMNAASIDYLAMMTGVEL